MKLIYNSVFLKHDTGMHPENYKRLSALGPLRETQIEDGEKYLRLFHQPSYIAKVKKMSSSGGGHLDNDTVVSGQSYQAAVAAVGATVMASRSGGFALVRPPGHHAHPDRSSGFCVFNNLAIAVQNLVNQETKVLIFDFDGHLGDGISKFFYGSNRVLYWSLHQYPAFPGWGEVEEIGSGAGKGFNINIPLSPRSGDDIYFRALETILPAVRQFNPGIVAVAAGFDAHQNDLLLDLRLSTGAFFRIGRFIRKNFKKTFAALEGGYNTHVLPKCIDNFLAGINGKSQKYKDEPTDSPIPLIEEYEARMARLKNILSPYWKL